MKLKILKRVFYPLSAGFCHGSKINTVILHLLHFRSLLSEVELLPLFRLHSAILSGHGGSLLTLASKGWCPTIMMSSGAYRIAGNFCLFRPGASWEKIFSVNYFTQWKFCHTEIFTRTSFYMWLSSRTNSASWSPISCFTWYSKPLLSRSAA